MKICIINNLFPYTRGGAERIVEIQKKGLIDLGCEVFVIATKTRHGIDKPIDKDTIYIKSSYLYLSKIPKILRLFWHIYDCFDVISYLNIKKILKEQKPDVVITHNLKGVGFLTPYAIKKLKIKHIHVLHDIQLLHPSGLMFYKNEKVINTIFSKVYQLICKNLFKSVDICVSPSKWLIEMHIEKKFFINAKKEIFFNPVVIQDIRKLSKKNDKIFTFLYVGQIERHKGIYDLIDAFKKIPSKDAELIIIGEGECLSEIKRLNNALNIKFIGKMNKAEVIRYMSNADCLVVPSLCYENSPTVIYEAFSNQLPVLGSSIGGIPELLDDGRGVLFEPGNILMLVSKMIEIKENKTSFMRLADKQRFFVEKFCYENYVKKIYQIIKN